MEPSLSTMWIQQRFDNLSGNYSPDGLELHSRPYPLGVRAYEPRDVPQVGCL